ncbi:hypothetical protein GCM10009745_63570 [Kribbella yunnanensis]|uniref:MBL fold metallo-hydrolase n=1 Tax=Kribbella yunnanensis TaxID=190194 RepID=A0ABP4UK43_9ACTN
MIEHSSPNVQVIDLAQGLWIWRLDHPRWAEGLDWQERVTSVCVDVGEERWLLDPLMPPDNAFDLWDRFTDRPPTAVAVLLPDHMRPTWADRETWSVDAVVQRYGCEAFGPNTFDPDMGEADTEVHHIIPGQQLPGGLVPLDDPRGWHETPMWIPEHRTLVFGDTLTERAGVLRIWASPTHEEAAVPALRSLLELPFERVIVSHGEPVHSRDAFEQALQHPPWPASSLHLAAWRGDLDQVKNLVKRGADLMARAESVPGTPLDWARKASLSDAGQPSHDDVISYLEARSAQAR